jgi:hypothetical protein
MLWGQYCVTCILCGVAGSFIHSFVANQDACMWAFNFRKWVWCGGYLISSGTYGVNICSPSAWFVCLLLHYKVTRPDTDKPYPSRLTINRPLLERPEG